MMNYHDADRMPRVRGAELTTRERRGCGCGDTRVRRAVGVLGWVWFAGLCGCQPWGQAMVAPKQVAAPPSAMTSPEPVDEFIDRDARLDQARSQVLSFIHRLDGASDESGGADRASDASVGGEVASEPIVPAGREEIVEAVPTKRAMTRDRLVGAQSATTGGGEVGAVWVRPVVKEEVVEPVIPEPVVSENRLPRVVGVSIGVGRTSSSVTGTPTVVAKPAAKPAASVEDGSPKLITNIPEGAGDGEIDVSIDQAIRALESQVEQSPNDVVSQWRLGLLRMATGDDRVGDERPAGMIDESAELFQRAVRTMAATRRAAVDPVTGIDKALVVVNELRDVLRDRAALTIPTVALCSRVRTFGVYDVLPAGSLKPYTPNQAIVYVEVSNFSSEVSSDGRFRTLLRERLEVLTPDGEVIWEREDPTMEDFSIRRREDFFVAKRVAFPTAMKTGDYVLKVTVSDLLADKWSQSLHPFRVGPEDDFSR